MNYEGTSKGVAVADGFDSADGDSGGLECLRTYKRCKHGKLISESIVQEDSRGRECVEAASNLADQVWQKVQDTGNEIIALAQSLSSMSRASYFSGIVVCEAKTSSKSGCSVEESGFAPMIIAAAPSPKRACPIRTSMFLTLGPWNEAIIVSAHTTSTREPVLFSAMSLATRMAVPPAWQP